MNLTALLTRDSFTLKRRGGADSEGNPLSALTIVGTYKGTWGSPSSRDVLAASREDQVVEAVIAGVFPARVGDHLIGLRGANWIVIMIRPLVTHNRYFLREAE